MVALAVLGRMGLETLTATGYPERLAAIETGGLPEPPIGQQLLSLPVRVAVFVLLAMAFVGEVWQLVVGAILFAVPELLFILQDRFPNFPRLYAVLPRGLSLIVFFEVVSAVGAAIALRAITNPDLILPDGFLLLLIPVTAFSFVQLVGREGGDQPINWPRRIAGIAVLVLGIWLVMRW